MAAQDGWQVVDLDHVITLMGDLSPDKQVAYREFLRVPSLSCGVYRLAAGSRDMQGPHDDDEVYYVLAGRARVRVGGAERAVQAGSLLYVRAALDHAFFEIEEDMTLLVIFANEARD
ncbi:MAG TPA: cupin domain-containing protein [Pseudomonadales bacterium]|nr:cupin domain-containing protein [Pseudomonadales bacterium]